MTTQARLKSKITNDWHSFFSELDIYKPMRLLRRCGPLLMGICLYRDSANKNYIPTAHVHCLANPMEDVTLSLAQRLRRPRSGAEHWIRFQEHDTQWREAAQTLARQSRFPLAGDVSLDRIVNAFQRATNDADILGGQSPSTYTDMLLTVAWTGRLEEARQLLSKAEEETRLWPEHYFALDGGRESWLSHLRNLTSSPENLRHVVELEVIKHKVENLPAADVSSWLK